MQTSAIKKKGRTVTPGKDGLEGDNETPARRRSRQESNLRRRIYDAWNVLKAASIIVEYDEKNFRYNPGILHEVEMSEQSEDEIIEEKLLEVHRNNKVVKNPSSLQSQERVQTDHTDGNVASSSPPGGASFDYESETKSLHPACEK